MIRIYNLNDRAERKIYYKDGSLKYRIVAERNGNIITVSTEGQSIDYSVELIGDVIRGAKGVEWFSDRVRIKEKNVPIEIFEEVQ